MGIGGSDSYLEGGVLIDVRYKDEWDSDHIDGAILIPNPEIEEKIASFVPDKETPINIHCASGMRASNAKSKLLKMGYKHVANLGGLSAAKHKCKGHEIKK
ncbi:Rhodanese-like domain containing protein [Trichomonas vaginalis G3]|uniref:Rhodanese-like domain containing protein n=1 Tax=Trichomonas vaginalis (strain ATCC PRA-98 / G3) TaxID=412133 RepID=A2EY87_TRIV3|nr:rhodanese homology domain (RHOD) domain-containing protein [Trichomonas vaginalis G3]EAY02375.1 Rhodanese-like domain containing protein [Trichomonas vaginalis G3]KAI5501203.1 rhodanese homology domain (RHOD) domain-containing protein [Trichomonas vaginalis G3]|eukprot:XP_001330636.1 Rhodanese-like domain containing protein [Trichomonas vaginalis G3]